jgi:hypothetical protein
MLRRLTSLYDRTRRFGHASLAMLLVLQAQCGGGAGSGGLGY